MENYLTMYQRIQALEGLLAEVQDALRNALNIATWYASDHKQFIFEGRVQDPFGSHALTRCIPGLLKRICGVLAQEGGEE